MTNEQPKEQPAPPKKRSTDPWRHFRPGYLQSGKQPLQTARKPSQQVQR